MTIAMGDWISAPASPWRSASGTRASAAASAVIKTGAKRSREPRRTASRDDVTPSCSTRWRMCVTSKSPLRVAMPKSAMKPMIVATDTLAPDA